MGTQLIRVTGKNVAVGDAFQSYVTEKFEKVLDKYLGFGVSGHIRLEKERGLFRTDCSMELRSGLVLQSHGEGGDANTSADAAFEHLEKRLRRHKRRLTNHHHGANRAAGQNAADYVLESPDEDVALADDAAPVIIAETRRVIRDVPVSEAVMQLDVSNEPFLVFRNSAHGGLNVVYRRADGNIGWIDPETTT